MENKAVKRLEKHLKSGHVYRREALHPFSKALDRELSRLVQRGTLNKVGAGLYYKPKLSRFGVLPPSNRELVEAFLRDDDFLLVSWNDYNGLGLGLTQLYNKWVVYNKKRHGIFRLSNITFDFRRPLRGFPKKVTPEFLLVDLLNNIHELAEESHTLKQTIHHQLSSAFLEKAFSLAKHYGKLSTLRYLKEITHSHSLST